MRKKISLVSLSIIFGVLVGWGEEVIPRFNLNQWNIVNIPFATILISLFIVLLLVSISNNFGIDILIIFLYSLSYIGIKLFLRFYTVYSALTIQRIVFFIILAFFSIISAIFLSIGRNFILRNKQKISKLHKRGGIGLAFPVIFFLFVLLVASIITVSESNVLIVLPYYLTYLELLIVLSFLLAIFSFNEISGFLIGFSSICIYFLLGKLIETNFNFSSILTTDRYFVIVVLSYAVIFGLSTLLIAMSSRIFVNSMIYKGLIKGELASVVKKHIINKKEKKPAETVPKPKAKKIIEKEKISDKSTDVLKTPKKDNKEAAPKPSDLEKKEFSQDTTKINQK